MRPSLRRLAESDRLLVVLWTGVALAAVALVALTLVKARGGSDAPTDEVETPATASATPGVVVPQLPADCLFISNFMPGAQPPRSNVPTPIVVTAPQCAAGTWEREPLDHLAAELRIELDAPDGPAQLLVPLAASWDVDGLRWSGSITFPLAGSWRPDLRIGGQSGMLIGNWLVLEAAVLESRAGLPLSPIEAEVTVLNVDRPGEPAHWDSLEGGGMAWIPGAKPGEAARLVWVQAREAQDWVVAGDPTTGVVTPLFEVEMPVSLYGAPDGRAFVVIDRLYDAPTRIRFYDAERARLVDVGTSRLDPGSVSWAPDSSVVLVSGGERALLLASDGIPLALDPWQLTSNVAWSPDSRWFVAVPAGGEGTRLLKAEVGTGKTVELLDESAGSDIKVFAAPTFSPDGRRFALVWTDSSEGTGGIAVFDRDEPPPLRLKDRTVASYQVPSGFSKTPWITTLAWAPDGASLIVNILAAGDGRASYDASRLEVIDVASKVVRLVVQPREGHYAYGPTWVSADGRALFKVWNSCMACDGGRSGLDVIDLANGAIVRTIEGGFLLGTIDGVRQLVSSPEGLLSVRGLEVPRTLMPGTWSGSTAFEVAPSPDGNRLAVRQSPGRMSPVMAVAPDGSTRTVLGHVDPNTQVVALRDAETALVFSAGTGWGWASLRDGAITPLPQQDVAMAETAIATAGAVSPDRSVAAYWVPGAAKPEVLLQLLDVRTGAVRPALARSEQTKGMYLTLSADGTRVLFPDGDALVTVDAATGTVRRFSFDVLGQPVVGRLGLPGARGPGGTFEVVAGGRLWRLDPASGDAQVVTDKQPSPGGWLSQVALSRSPDGRRLVALTWFGLFELQTDGSWRFVTGAGWNRRDSEPPRLVWSADSNRVAYVGGEGRGIVVVGLDGSGAYELVKRDANGRALNVLDWLPDGRIVYVVSAQGL